MLGKITSRLWLILAFAVISALIGAVSAWHANVMMKPLCVAHTSLLESRPILAGPKKIEALAGSQEVLTRSSRALARIGVYLSPEELVSAMAVTPVKDTDIVAIDVIMRDTATAKAAATALARELRREYTLRYAARGDSGRLVTIEPVYTRPAKTHEKLRLAFGITAGGLTGLLLGFIAAALIPKREHNNVS